MTKAFSGIISLMLLLGSTPLWAQTKQETEREITSLKTQIAAGEKQLAQHKAEEQSALRTLRSYDRQIKLKENLVGRYQTRRGQIRQERHTLTTTIDSLTALLETLKADYQARVVHAYKYGRANDWALILSAQSPDEALVKVQYLKRFAQQRRKRLDDIETTQSALAREQDALAQALRRNTTLLRETEAERQKLDELKSERNGFVEQARSAQSEIAEELVTQRAQKAALETRLAELIAAERRRRTDNNPASLSEAERAALSDSFVQNKGTLPWPVRGTVTSEYGIQTHPVHRTKTENLGIEIATEAGAEVRAIFKGRVLSQTFIPNYGDCLLITHGDYTTVYGNLSAILVSEGQTIETGQLIGRSGTTAEPLDTALFFALWQNGNHTDPRPWFK